MHTTPPSTNRAADTMDERLLRQIDFIKEIDGLKSVLRRNLIMDGSRRENSCEHSWHIAVMALSLREYAAEPVDISRVVAMLLLHDVVEVDAGDTFCYDEAGNEDRSERERAAADRIFGLLPLEQGREMRALWEEFEERATPDSKFANALDRVQPLLCNFETEGGTWRIHGIRRPAVERRMLPVKDGSPRLHQLVLHILDQACARGILKE